jgi:hypothetical protein
MFFLQMYYLLIMYMCAIYTEGHGQYVVPANVLYAYYVHVSNLYRGTWAVCFACKCIICLLCTCVQCVGFACYANKMDGGRRLNISKVLLVETAL